MMSVLKDSAAGGQRGSIPTAIFGYGVPAGKKTHSIPWIHHKTLALLPMLFLMFQRIQEGAISLPEPHPSVEQNRAVMYPNPPPFSVAGGLAAMMYDH